VQKYIPVAKFLKMLADFVADYRIVKPIPLSALRR